MTLTVPDLTDTRDCRLYRFWVTHPVTGERVLGYIGETVRAPFERLMEHVYAQPWADTIVAWEVDGTVYPGKAAVLKAETAAINDERPLYNIKGNMRNPLRVKPWDAQAQRWARDDAAGKPRWVPPKERAGEPTARVPSPTPRLRPTAQRRGVLSWPARVGFMTAGWVSTTALWWLWLDAHRVLEQHGARWHGVLAGTSAAVVLVWAVRRKPLTRKQWQRRVRRWLR